MASVTKIMLRFLHYGPLLATFIIILVTMMTTLCIIFSTPITSFRLPDGRASFKHHPTWTAFANLTIFLSLSVLTTYHFIMSMIYGPGFVKKGWKPNLKKNEDKVQYCQECEAYKCPRSHHCRKCNRCVLKMDHHCPWINCCVGHYNHAHFLRFLFYASSGCFYGGINIGSIIIKMIFYGKTNFILIYYFNGFGRFIILIFSLGIAFGVSLAVGFLLVMQLRDVSKNTTNIEAWIIKKAEWRHEMINTKFTYPYNLGSRWKNLTQVLNMSNFALGDGYTWPTVEGTDQYTFTIEQIEQKKLKKDRMVPHQILRPYNGRCISGLTLANPALLCICNGCDDRYLSVSVGDAVMVSRYRKRWLYGCKTLQVQGKAGGEVSKEVSGWFPRFCAAETIKNKKE